MLIEAIGIGMFLSLILTETIGLAAGGIVVPGYIALTLHNPIHIISTIVISVVTFVVVKALSRYVILYGRRLLIASVLIGYLLAYITKTSPALTFNTLNFNIETVGFVIPGLIAYWIARQGIFQTVAAMIIISSLVRLILIIIHNGAVLP